MSETVETNVIGNDIDNINKWLDEYGVPRQHKCKLVGYTTWGRISHVLEERDQLRAALDNLLTQFVPIDDDGWAGCPWCDSIGKSFKRIKHEDSCPWLAGRQALAAKETDQ